MKNKYVSGTYGAFERVNKKRARMLFECGCPIALMTNDRNPVNSLTSEIVYRKYGYLHWNSDEKADDFDSVLEDFAEWLDNDGYGHVPSRSKARRQLFSYWLRLR